MRNVKFDDIQEPPAYIDYLPYSQREWGFGDFEVRYNGDFSAISAEVQQAIHSIDRRLPITNVMTMDELVARSYLTRRSLPSCRHSSDWWRCFSPASGCMG